MRSPRQPRRELLRFAVGVLVNVGRLAKRHVPSRLRVPYDIQYGPSAEQASLAGPSALAASIVIAEGNQHVRVWALHFATLATATNVHPYIARSASGCNGTKSVVSKDRCGPAPPPGGKWATGPGVLGVWTRYIWCFSQASSPYLNQTRVAKYVTH